MEGLPGTIATVFRIDAAGVGYLMAEPALNPGQGYRLLVPPALASVELKPGQVNSLRDGWRFWELSASRFGDLSNFPDSFRFLTTKIIVS